MLKMYVYFGKVAEVAIWSSRQYVRCTVTAALPEVM